MTTAQFFEKFDLIAGAPDAVAKMREIVFQLMVAGRLIPDTLERPVEEDIRLMGTVVELVMGQAPAGHECNSEGQGTVFVKVGEFGALYPREEVWTTNPLKFAKKGDVLVCVVGATVGKLNLAIDCAIGRSVAAIRPSAALDTKFLYYSLIPYTLRLRRNSRGSAQGVIGKAELNAISLWVPSREVQRRIVAKVDELMALCDQLEAQQQERETKHTALAQATLARFVEAPTPDNLNLLFHSSFSVQPPDLRKTILTFAVQGKLVPQDPTDEPAEVLLARISKLRSDAKTYNAVSDDEKAYNLPQSWLWARLGDVAISSDSGWSPQCLPHPAPPNSWGVLKVSAVSWGQFLANENKALPLGVQPRPNCQVRPGDFLLSRANTAELVARSVVVGDTRDRLMMSDKIVRFHLPDIVDKRFINLANNSYASRSYYVRHASGTSDSMRNVGREVMCNLPIPLPPLAEQKRIVAKVEELMALVDALEAKQAAADQAATHLLDAVVSELAAAA